MEYFRALFSKIVRWFKPAPPASDNPWLVPTTWHMVHPAVVVRGPYVFPDGTLVNWFPSGARVFLVDGDGNPLKEYHPEQNLVRRPPSDRLQTTGEASDHENHLARACVDSMEARGFGHVHKVWLGDKLVLSDDPDDQPEQDDR